jgi:hypothetical protein
MQTDMNRRRLVVGAGLAGVAGGLAGCAALGQGPRTVEISEAQLLALISRPFPRSQRYFELFDVTLSAPRLRLMPETHRIGTELSYSLGASVLSERQMTGTLALSYGLRFEPADATLRLADVKVERFDLSALPRAYAGRGQRLGALLTEELLQDLVIHRLDAADQRRLAERRLRPAAVRVLPGRLQLQLDPVAP